MFKKNNPIRNFRIAIETEIKEINNEYIKNIDKSHYNSIFNKQHNNETVYGLFVHNKIIGIAYIIKIIIMKNVI